MCKFNEWVNKKSTSINYKLFKKYFKFQRPSDMLKDLYRTNKYKNNKLVNVMKSRLSDLKNEIEDMSEEEKENEKPNEIIDIVEKNLEFNTRSNV